MPKRSTANPDDRRIKATAEKLRAALDRLTNGSSEQPAASIRRLTVAALAREAGVGRNAIYANHRDILDALIRARRRQSVPDRITTMGDTLVEQRGVIDNRSGRSSLRMPASSNAPSRRNAVPRGPSAAAPT